MMLAGERYVDAPRKSRMLAGLYRNAAARHGAFFLDAASVLAGNPAGEAHGPDGMHLNEEDHAALANAVLEALQKMFPVGMNRIC